MKKVRNIDIAAALGISPAAVSIALHGRKGISEETRLQILKKAKEMGYSASSAAASENEAYYTGLLIPSYNQMPSAEVIKRMTRFASMCDTQFHIFTVTQAMENFPSHIMGCRVMFVYGEIDKEYLERISSVVTDIVMADGSYNENYLYIQPDYMGAAERLINYLIKLGHRNFLYINEYYPPEISGRIFEGFQEPIMRMRFPLTEKNIFDVTRNDSYLWSNLVRIIKEQNISAIFCTTDQTSVRVSQILRNSGFHIPEDISIGELFEDTPPAHPAYEFTGVGLDMESMALNLRDALKMGQKNGMIPIKCQSVTMGTTAVASKYDPSSKRIAIALVHKEHPTFRIVRAGFINTIHRYGYQAEVVGIPDDNAYAYKKTCLSLLDQNIDGLIMWIPYPDVIAKFSEAGIPVVTPHTYCKEGSMPGLNANLCALPQDTARNVAEYFIANLKSHHGVIAISRTGDNDLENAIASEFTRIMHERCPHIVVFDELRIVEHSRQSTWIIKDYIRRTPNLLGAFTTAGTTCASWVEAKRELGMDEIVIVGTDYTEETLELVADGSVQAFVAQPLYEEAQGSVIALDMLLRGNSYPYLTVLDAPLVTKDKLIRYQKLLQDVNNWYA